MLWWSGILHLYAGEVQTLVQGPIVQVLCGPGFLSYYHLLYSDISLQMYLFFILKCFAQPLAVRMQALYKGEAKTLSLFTVYNKSSTEVNQWISLSQNYRFSPSDFVTMVKTIVILIILDISSAFAKENRNILQFSTS